MIGLSRLLGAPITEGDILRYQRPAEARRPVVVWNCTRTCNLHCLHCYADSEPKAYSGELTTAEAKTMIEDLAAFGVPALLFSGGEPLLRKDIFELAAFARSLGLRTTLSTNGTLITKSMAAAIQAVGFQYVGISLDGIGPINDHFRGRVGAFAAAVNGIRRCLAVHQKVGLRMTLTRHNIENLTEILDFIEDENIPRVCFYHLVGSGRGRSLLSEDLFPHEVRSAMDLIINRTQRWGHDNRRIEVLTVDNPVDGIYLYLKIRERDPRRAEDILALLNANGGGRFGSGVGIADIDFQGNVHPDQFWMHETVGNVRKRPFSRIWMDTSHPLMAGLKDKLSYLHGRCVDCAYKESCGGGMRVRADLATGDPWGPDPACYLTEAEIHPHGQMAAA